MSREHKKEVLQQLDIKLKLIKKLQLEIKELQRELEQLESRGINGYRNTPPRSRRKE